MTQHSHNNKKKCRFYSPLSSNNFCRYRGDDGGGRQNVGGMTDEKFPDRLGAFRASLLIRWWWTIEEKVWDGIFFFEKKKFFPLTTICAVNSSAHRRMCFRSPPLLYTGLFSLSENCGRKQLGSCLTGLRSNLWGCTSKPFWPFSSSDLLILISDSGC